MNESASNSSYTGADGHRGVLWASVHDAVHSAKHAYDAPTSDARRKRRFLFRGQANADWALIPSLHRPPNDADTVRKRFAYTSQFLDHFTGYAPTVGIASPSEAQCLAVAQHYGCYTTLLDFKWNIDVAAYFASVNNHGCGVGVIYMYHAEEYDQMREVSQHFAGQRDAKRLKTEGLGPLPPLRLHEYNDVLRIRNQEGVFVDASAEDAPTLMRQCIDRLYFRQSPGIVYKGQMQMRVDSLPDRGDFGCDEDFASFIASAESQRPDLFAREPSVTAGTIYPFDDPVSNYVLFWREFNPEQAPMTGRTFLQNGDDITFAGLMPSREWLGKLAAFLRHQAGDICLITLKDLGFLAALVRSLRLILFGEQPIIVGLEHYKTNTFIIELDRFLYSAASLEDEFTRAQARYQIVVVVIGAGTLTEAQNDFVRFVTRRSERRRRSLVVFATVSSTLMENRDLPACFGPGRLAFLG